MKRRRQQEDVTLMAYSWVSGLASGVAGFALAEAILRGPWYTALLMEGIWA